MANEVTDTIAVPELIKEKLSDTIIYEGEFLIKSGEILVELEGEIHYLITPNPEVRFKARILKAGMLDLLKNVSWELTTPTGIKGEFYLTDINVGFKEGRSESTIEGSLQYELSISTAVKFKELNFSVLNFINNFDRAYQYEKMLYIGRTELKYKDYLITLDKSPENKSIFSQLKAQGGYSITHIGQIKRLNGKAFDLNEVDNILKNLAWIFSFVAGRRVDINHIYTDFEEFSMICYRIPTITSWKSISNWYPEKSRESLEEVLSCLLILLEDKYWEKQLPRILSQYFDGFGPSYLENRIIGIQAGLETLAWAYLVETKSLLNKKEYNGLLSAGNKIERLLTELKIETDYERIPAFQEMGDNYDHGPHLFTTIRNDIVHPERNKKELNSEQFNYIWRMGMCYFELVVLALSGYTGDYNNMMLDIEFQPERVRKVPWAKSNEPGR
ncbi:hypothetical protein SporoP8_13450 [Sporosarcina ureae]|uniref:hypothetical protein n=1 Tax=Sporosarcina TaxID=1569 RepID=UPI000A14E283|nr:MULTISPECIES: hypothetical protein [Sporosarcina]ARJ39792.1 hypothetical protein SporoP8_13450 [Sporosarcina ureae]PIC82035.1 hypothetical protein CSV73_14490 [Sporosarcina sp. P1]